jgi:thermolysin
VRLALCALAGALCALAVAFVSTASVSAGRSGDDPNDFRALTGARAASFTLPDDVVLVRRLALAAHGLTYERYQQVYGAAEAQVYGGQLTLYRNASGQVVSVIGSHYSRITPTNSVSTTAAAARERAGSEFGRASERLVQLMIEPAGGRYFYRVDSRQFGKRWVHWIDAGNGAIIRRYDAIAEDHGVGVKGDVKSMSGLTTFHAESGHLTTGPHWDLVSSDGRQTTFDARNGFFFLYDVTDVDNHWTTSGRASPGHPALVDAHYYANVTDDYFVGRHGLNWGSCYTGGMRSGAHYSFNHNNAFWDGRYTVYGDGDGTLFRELSGGLDVVAHENTHGVTECTSGLAYVNEPGALNESFSDMLGSSAEFFAAEATAGNCVRASGQAVCADWWIGEDVYLPADAKPGFRNMADPQEDGDPDHYSERYTGTDDNGGVHSNSAIPNHAYYLVVNGGRNASCASPADHDAGHCSDPVDTQDNDVVVAGTGLADAERIFFLAFIALPQNATMCDARAATEAQAVSLFGALSPQKLSTTQAWLAVGLTDAVCGGGSTNTPPSADGKTATTSAGTPVEVALSGADAETCELLFSVVSGPTNGTLGALGNAPCVAGSPHRDGATVTYTPAGGFVGSDSFTYKVNDGFVDSSVATVSITVAPPPSVTSLHVGDLDYVSTKLSRGNWKATVTILVHDANESPSAAVVSGTFSQGSWSRAVSCTTSANGTCTVDSGAFQSNEGKATFTVTSVSSQGAVYVQGSNHDPDGSSNGTTIQLSK